MTEKKRINSKAKGSEYERKVAKVLGGWWEEDFHRTPASGGLHWAEDNRVAGDIVTPTGSIYPWVTELKKREEWEYDHFLKGTGEIEKYWQQVCRDSERTGLKPLLIFSKNFAPNYLMIELYDFNAIMEGKGWLKPRFNYFVINKAGHSARVVCILEDFIKHVSKADVIRAFGLNVTA